MSLHFTFIPLLKIMLLKKNKKMPIKNNIYRHFKELLENDQIPLVLNESKCKKCAYYAYCYI